MLLLMNSHLCSVKPRQNLTREHTGDTLPAASSPERLIVCQNCCPFFTCFLSAADEGSVGWTEFLYLDLIEREKLCPSLVKIAVYWKSP